MKKIIALILILGAGLLYFSLSYHFILFDEHLKILKKNNYTLHNTFMDARGAKALKLALEPDLVKAGVKELLGRTKGLSLPTNPGKR